MLGVLLTILKVLGIIILSIIGLALVILLLVLFVPIRYRLEADIPEISEESGRTIKDASGSFKFSWLLHILNGGIEYPGELAFKVRIFCFTVFNSAGSDKDEDCDGDDSSNSEDTLADEYAFDYKSVEGLSDNSENSDNTISAESIDSTGNASISENSGTIESDFDNSDGQSDNADEKPYSDIDTDTDNYSSIEDNTDEDSCTEDSLNDYSEDWDDEESTISGFIEKIGQLFNKVIEIIKIPQHVFSKFKCTISSICGKIELIKNTIENPIFKRAFVLTKKHLIKILKNILPRKIDIDISYGLDDPATTADIMSKYGMLYPWIGDKIRLNPYFDKKLVEGTVRIKGKITLFGIIYSAAVVYFNKDVKKVIKRFERIMKG